MTQRGFVAIVFLLGCATGGVASQLAVPAAVANAPGTRSQYTCHESVISQAMPLLAKSSGEGWELSTMFVSKYEPDGHGQVATRLGFCLRR